MQTTIYPVTDLAASTAFFAAFLGVEPTINEPYYVQFDASGQTVGLDPNGAANGLTGSVGFVDVADIQASIAALVDAGGTVVKEPNDVGGGMQIAVVAEPSGSLVGVRSVG